MKTIELVLTSGAGEDKIELSADLWEKFEKLAGDMEIPVERLLFIALMQYLGAEGDKA